MKSALVFLFLVGLSCAQRTLPPSDDRDPTRPPIRPTLVPDTSRCSRERRCPEGQMCVLTRSDDTLTTRCVAAMEENGNCMETEVVDGDMDERKVVDDPRRLDPDKVNRERAAGARDRDNARTITGTSRRPSCAEGLNCVADTCMRRTPTTCDMQRMTNEMVRCREEDGNFEPLQCRRLANETDATRVPRPTALRCYCANPRNGDRVGRMVNDNDDVVGRREELPDCGGQSFMRCTAMRDNRMVFVHNGESLPEGRGNDGCRRCECNNGTLTCSQPADNAQSCARSDPDVTPRNCMADGEIVMHGQQRMEGKCNRCGCRNGKFQCTRVPECRDNTGNRDEEREAEDMQCDQCMNMTRSPVCAVSEGRTFPTRCHAMRCQGLQLSELAEGTCSDRNACEEDQACVGGSVCMRRGGQTRMTRQGAMPDQRRLCVNRTNLQCLPTVISGGRERLDDAGEDDPIEALERDDRERDNSDDRDEDDDDNSDDKSVCASDGNTYPSTCHMMTRSTGNMVPRVRFAGRCADSDDEGNEGDTRDMVCACDGVTYENKGAMRAQGGNLHMDYSGRCDNPGRDNDNTPSGRCKNVKDSERCRDLSGCTRRVMLTDGCCPVCGSTVIMALDQEALVEHILATGGEELDNLDDFMGRLFHEDTDREPVIRRNATRRCEISPTRPITIPGNNVEVLFRARDMAMDAGYCHMQAMRMMMRLNDNQVMTQTAISAEEALIVAAVVAPEVTSPGSGAPALAASILVMLSAVFAGLFF